MAIDTGMNTAVNTMMDIAQRSLTENRVNTLNAQILQGEKTSQELGKDDFLTMLITQLQNQDPLNPTDSVEYTAQLAQFSSLEQLSNVNQNLEYLQMFQASINNAQAVSFIGKEITALGDGIQVTDGVAEACEFRLSADASGVTIAAVQGLYEMVQGLQDDVEALQQENARLRRELRQGERR